MNKERSYRRFLALCITLLLLLLAAGWGIMEGPETQADTQAVSDFGYQITSQADAKPAVSASTLPSESIGGSDSHSAVTAGQGIGETATRAVKPEPTAVAPTTERPQETAAVSPKQATVALAVTCRNAVANGIQNWPGYSGIVPANGVIYENSAVPIAEGETVLDVLKKVLKEQKIPLSEKHGYVRSINGLNEKLRGEQSFPQSGWLYQVNGVFPNMAANQYKLQAGDRMEWVYTCKPGDTKRNMQ